MEYIVVLDELRHFGRAAKRCHVSQPTLSVQVALVEEALGATLFERTPGAVMPTPIGAEFAKGARLALSAVDEIVALATGDNDALGGQVRLGTAPTFGPYFLPRFLPGIHRKYPPLKIYINEDRPSLVETAVLDGTLDCGLGPAPERPGLQFCSIGVEKLYLGVPTEHRLADRESVSTGDLRGERLLALGSGHHLLDNVRRLATAAGATVVDDYQGTSLDSIRQMVSIGMGCSLFPELYARAEFRKDDDVKLLEVIDWEERREVGLYWRESSGRKAHYEVLAGEARQVAQALQLYQDFL